MQLLRPDGLKWPRSAVSPDMLQYSNSKFLHLYFFHFSMKVSIDNFSLEADHSLQHFMKFVPYIETGFLIGQNWQEVAISIDTSRHSNSSFSKVRAFKTATKV